MPRARKRRQLTDVVSLPRLREQLRTDSLVPIQQPRSFRAAAEGRGRLGRTHGVTIDEIASLAADLAVERVGVSGELPAAAQGEIVLGVIGEAPVGAVNGSNLAFTLLKSPATTEIELWVDGSLLERVQNNPVAGQYVKLGQTVTCAVPPFVFVEVDYGYRVTGNPSTGYILSDELTAVDSSLLLWQYAQSPDQTRAVSVYFGPSPLLLTTGTPAINQFRFTASNIIEIGLAPTVQKIRSSYFAAISRAEARQEIFAGTGGGLVEVTLAGIIFERNVRAYKFYPGALGFRLNRVDSVPAGLQFRDTDTNTLELGEALTTGQSLVVEFLQ